MARYSVAKAKDGLSGLIDQALRGEEVVITRRGEPVAEIRSRREKAPGTSREATARLRRRIGGDERSLGIPLERFGDWLYGDEPH